MTNEPPADPVEPSTPPAPQPETLTLTTDALNARLNRAKNAAASEFLAELGFKSKDELASVIKAQREAAEAQQTEAERERTRANEAAVAATQAAEALKAERMSRAVMEAALKAGVPGERIGAVTRLVDTAAITYADGAISGADEAVMALIAENAWITAGAVRPPVGGGANGGAQGNGSPASGLTADQLDFARKTGVSPERYAAALRGGTSDGNAEYVASSLEAMAKAARGT